MTFGSGGVLQDVGGVGQARWAADAGEDRDRADVSADPGRGGVSEAGEAGAVSCWFKFKFNC